jgi:hypothetical protein
MKFLSDTKPWATILTVVLVAIAAIAGGVVVIVNSEALSFAQYLDQLKTFALAVGLLGVGRGIVSYGRSTAEAASLSDNSLIGSGPPSDDWRIDPGTELGIPIEPEPPRPIG